MSKLSKENITIIGNKLNIGQKAPEFNLLDMDLNEKTLKNYEGKIKILSCFPSIDTDVCDLQTKKFAEKYANNNEVVILNISVDLPFAFKKWCLANNKDIIALSDYRTNQFGKDYGILIEHYKLLFRSVFVIDKSDNIALALYNDELSKSVDFEKVEKVIEELRKN